MLFISIPTPCHEKWNEMSPNEQGAFCSVCSKTVVDFTHLSDEEVQNYFLNKRGQKTCGRFRNDQLAKKDDPLAHILAATIPFWKKFLAIVVVVFGSLLTSCNNQSTVGVLDVKLTDIKLEPGMGTPVVYDTMAACTVPDDTSITITYLETMGELAIEPPLEVKPVIDEEPFMGEVVHKIQLDENGNQKEPTQKDKPKRLNP